MSKFTFFTILFSLVIMVIVGQLVLRDALFPQEFETNLMQEGSGDVSPYVSEAESEMIDPGVDELDELDIPVLEESSRVEEITPLAEPVFEPKPIVQTGNVLTQLLLQRVGFSEISNKIFLGKVFDLFDVISQNIASVVSFEFKEGGVTAGVATELELLDEISAQEFYRLLQNKTKVYVDLWINETNQYGDRSFYVNHRKKPDEAFIIVRMKNRIYAFAYLKDYHPRIKTLITFLYTAILDRQ